MDIEKIIKDENRNLIFIDDLNYYDLKNGYGLISSYKSNSWLIEKNEILKQILDFSKNKRPVDISNIEIFGLELINNMYLEGLVGISDSIS